MSDVRCLELVSLETVKFEGAGQKSIHLFPSPPPDLLSHLKACRHHCLAPLLVLQPCSSVTELTAGPQRSPTLQSQSSSANPAGLSLGSCGYADKQHPEPG